EQHGAAEIQPRRRRRPVAELHRERLVEAEPRPLAGKRLLAGTGADAAGDEIAGRQPRQDERGRRHRRHQHEREREAPREVARNQQQWTTGTTSGRHNNCGRASDGVTFSTRADDAAYTRGAAKNTIGTCSQKICCTWSYRRLRSAWSCDAT